MAASDAPADLRTSCRIVQQLSSIQKNGVRGQGIRPKEPVFEQTEAFRLKVAKHALLYFSDIGSIRGNKTLSEERKQSMVMDHLFN